LPCAQNDVGGPVRAMAVRREQRGNARESICLGHKEPHPNGHTAAISAPSHPLLKSNQPGAKRLLQDGYDLSILKFRHVNAVICNPIMTARRRPASSIRQDGADRGEADPDNFGDPLAHHALASEPQDVSRLSFGGWSPALVLSLALGLRMELTRFGGHL